jgi:dynein heavy chain, axonemal
MFDDINDILNGEEFAHLYSSKDLEKIADACPEDCIKKGVPVTQSGAFIQYLQRIKTNLRIIFVMNPKSERFAERIRMFPSIMKCSDINWIDEWPETALLLVAKSKMAETAFEY